MMPCHFGIDTINSVRWTRKGRVYQLSHELWTLVLLGQTAALRANTHMNLSLHVLLLCGCCSWLGSRVGAAIRSQDGGNPLARQRHPHSNTKTMPALLTPGVPQESPRKSYADISIAGRPGASICQQRNFAATAVYCNTPVVFPRCLFMTGLLRRIIFCLVDRDL